MAPLFYLIKMFREVGTRREKKRKGENYVQDVFNGACRPYIKC